MGLSKSGFRRASLHHIQGHQTLLQHRRQAVQAGSVNPEVMEAVDAEPATSSPVAAPIRPFATGGDETMEQEGQKARDSEPWLVSLYVLSYLLLTRFL